MSINMPHFNFAKRSEQPELMDNDTISFAEFHHCLSELNKINLLTLAYRPVKSWLKQIIKINGPKLTILDVGSGGGDTLHMLEDMASRKNYALQLVGVDLNPWSKKSSQLRQKHDSSIVYESCNIFDFLPIHDFDTIISSLFTHHLTNDQLIIFIRLMENHTRCGWLINDLHRHFIPFYFIKYAVKMFSKNRLIRHDAPVSVARAFTKKDWEILLTRAGVPLNHVCIKWFFPFRYAVIRCK